MINIPWFKVDDNLPFHAKVVAAGNAAMGLWVRAGAWSAQMLTEGYVPDHIISALGGTKSAPSLVKVGLWNRSEGGYAFRDWDCYQPSKSSIEADREAAKLRQQKARDKARQQRDAAMAGTSVTHTSRDDHAVTHADVTPPVTVPPTRPDPTLLSSKEDGSRKRGSRLPQGWIPDEPVRQQMQQEFPNVDFRDQHARFTDYWIAQPGQKGVKVDWNATWRNWIRRAAGFAPSRQPELVNTKPWTPEPPPAEIADDPEACDRWYREQAERRAAS